MAKVKLTKTAIQAVNPAPGVRVYLWDEEVRGFGIRIIGGGSRIFLLKRQKDGRPSWLKIGAYGYEFTVEQAREIAKTKSGDIARGMDLAKVRDDRKKAPKVSDLVQRFIEEEGPKLKPRTLVEYTRQLEKRLLPALGSRKVEEVSFSDIERIHNALRNTPTESNRTHACFSRLFNLAERWGMRQQGTNPCARHEKFREESRDRFLSDEELQSLGTALDSAQEGIVVTNALRFLLFSGWRLNEALSLSWEDLDNQAKVIRLGDTKGGAATIDINPDMETVLEEMKDFQKQEWLKAKKAWRTKKESGEPVGEEPEPNPFVFPGREEGGHLVNLRKPWVRLCQKAGIQGVRLHDIRRTFGTVGAGDAGLSHETIGKVLRHKQTSTSQVYARLASSIKRDASTKVAGAMRQKLAKKSEKAKGQSVPAKNRGA